MVGGKIKYCTYSGPYFVSSLQTLLETKIIQNLINTGKSLKGESWCCLIAKLCLNNFCNPMDCNPPDSSVHGISQARILEWVAISFSRGSSRPRDWTCVSCIGRQILYCWGTREAQRKKVLTQKTISKRKFFCASYSSLFRHVLVPLPIYCLYLCLIYKVKYHDFSTCIMNFQPQICLLRCLLGFCSW